MIKKDFVKLYAEMNNVDIKKSTEDVDEFLETLKDIFKTSSKVVFKNFGIFWGKRDKSQKDFRPKKPDRYNTFKT